MRKISRRIKRGTPLINHDGDGAGVVAGCSSNVGAGHGNKHHENPPTFPPNCVGIYHSLHPKGPA